MIEECVEENIAILQKEMGTLKMGWTELEKKTEDREVWRVIVGGLCSSRSER